MIESKQYLEKTNQYFSFLNTEFHMNVINEKVRGNAFYDVQYDDDTKIISINYENIEDYFQVTIFKLQNGKMPDYDDETKTLHLNKLNLIVMPKVDNGEINLNNECFNKFNASNELERKLLKSAKSLRLCLKHIQLWW